MTTILRNASGTAFTQGIIQDISVKNATKSSVIPLPGVDKDVIQKFGKRNREFDISGIVTGSTGVNFIENLYSTTGSFYFSSSALGIVLIDTTVVYFSDAGWIDRGSRPLERKFSITMIEVL